MKRGNRHDTADESWTVSSVDVGSLDNFCQGSVNHAWSYDVALLLMERLGEKPSIHQQRASSWAPLWMLEDGRLQ